MKALILAAGRGTRLQPYTDHTPKPLFTLAGRPLLDILIGHLVAHGTTEIMINTHHLADRIADHVRRSHYPVPVHVRFEPEILGTAGAIRNVADFWGDDPFMVINGDIYTTLNLKQLYTAHQRFGASLTLALTDYPAINTVCLDTREYVCGFRALSDRPDPPQASEPRWPVVTYWTFTGIQVVDPALLAYIPSHQFADSVTWYRRLMKESIPIKAYLNPHARWADLGTPAAYREAARQALVEQAFETINGFWDYKHVVVQELAGDASDRQWYRLTFDDQTLILGDHGIRPHLKTCEADAFTAIGHHLKQQGVAVPTIQAADPFAGLVVMEDLGDWHLQRVVQEAPSEQDVRNAYRQVFEALLTFNLQGLKGFQSAWTHQSAAYHRELILEKECRYFMEAFVAGYMGLEVKLEGPLLAECQELADQALNNGLPGLIHRDCQSRNIMWPAGKPYFIDFQGARPGPLQYDLASLLLDPYVALPEQLQAQLQADYLEQLAARVAFDKSRWLAGYTACALTRLLQMLGAFGFLTTVKSKHQFETYIPIALQQLHRRLAPAPRSSMPYPVLQNLVQRLVGSMVP